MSKTNEPSRSQGGTFIRDTTGKLLEHIPPTRPAPPLQAAQAAPGSAENPPEEAPAPPAASARKPATRPVTRRGR